MDASREIENLLYRYAEAIDLGDLETVARLFGDATIEGPDGNETVGYDAVLKLYQQSTRIYPETGTPGTRHVTSNAIIEVDESGDKATCRSYFTVFQAVDGFPLQAIIAGRYHDRFVHREQGWQFSRRKMLPELFGDLSRHLLFDPQSIITSPPKP